MILATNIQRFSLHDGPGIRTTVFLKGCWLRCPWCSNPENLEYRPQKYIKDGAEGVYGVWYTPDQLLKALLKDEVYYRTGGNHDFRGVHRAEDIEQLPGGVTFSGGEALLQMQALEPVLLGLRHKDIHIAMETSLYAPEESLTKALKYVDLFYCDIKLLANERVSAVERGDVSQFLLNFDLLMQSSRPVVVRIPVIKDYTDDRANRQAILRLLQQYVKHSANLLKLELIKGHNLGAEKYKSLGFVPPADCDAGDDMMEVYSKELAQLQIPVEICRI